jgi:chromate transporter
VVTLWVTFVPCFLWIFAGAPYVEWISHQPRLTGALNAITAAVVGVILNLSLWFALQVLFGEVTNVALGPMTLALPTLSTLIPGALILSALAAALLLWRKIDLLKVLPVMALAGLGYVAVTGGL